MEKSYSKQTQKAYHHELKKRKTKVVSILSMIALLFGLAAALLYFNRINEVYIVFFWIAIGGLGTFLIIIFFVAFFFVSEKPLYQFLYPKVVDDHNYEESSYISYTAYPKDKEFINFGMLYPKMASKVVRFKLSFESNQGHHVDVYDTYIYTSSNNSSHIYLNGYYMVVRDYGPDVFQIKTNGSSYFKPKLKRIPNSSKPRLYVQEGVEQVHPMYLKFYNRIKEEYRSPDLSLCGNGNDLHIGITLRPMRRNLKELNDQTYQMLRNSLVQLVDLANIIDDRYEDVNVY